MSQVLFPGEMAHLDCELWLSLDREQNMMTGAQIRAARRFLDWSLRDLGKKAKVHFNTVHAIERGKSVAKPETLAAIREALASPCEIIAATISLSLCATRKPVAPQTYS
jgi:transcriptional regulator with XRE-family HTH domain